MSLRRSTVAALAVGIALVAPAACSSDTTDQGTNDGAESRRTTTTTRPLRPGVDGALVVGQLAPLSGSVSPIADSFTTPAKLAIDEMNLAGGVNGEPVALVVADDGSAVATAQPAFAKLVDSDRVDAIIGPSSSEIAADLIPKVRDARVVICSGSNTAGALSTIDSDGFYFRTAPGDQLQADAIAKLVIADGHTSPLVLAARDSYGLPFGQRVVRRLHAKGAKSARLVTTPPDADPTAAITGALTRVPDSVVLIGFPDTAAPVIRALAAAGKGPNQLPTYGSDGLQTADLGALVDPANPAVVAGLKGTTPAGAPAGIEHPFNGRMLSAGVEPFFSAGAYDCTILVGLAAVAAESDDPSEIRDHFAANLDGKTDCTTFVDCRTLLDANRSIHYRGASSGFERWKRVEPGTGTYDVWTLGLDTRPTIGPATVQIPVP